ncbi:MAG TPA: CaiB/BaiF CoA-transferase family protein [Burkholderiaceae bacterium]|nr:CaiB/BaiF CoA-transferase family protein [Burkholderiaceae bacterium]
MSGSRGPLSGLRVVSLAEQYPGPYATLLMADLGAEVILVERPGAGDPARRFRGFHEALNRNKRAVAIDLKSEAGREALRGLLRTADVMLEGFRPGTMERLGFGWTDVSALAPRVVYVSISGFGQHGPHRDRPAHDLSYQAMAGLLYAQARSGEPLPAGDLAIGDLSSAMFATVGALAALHERARTGRGRHVDVSMTDGLVSWMSVMLGPTMNGEPLADIAAEPAYGTFRCGDGRLLTLSIAHEDWFWRPLCGLLGLDDAAGFGRDERVADAASLRARIAAALQRAPRATWAERLDAAGIAWGPLHDLDEVVRDPHFIARGLFREVPDGRGGTRRVVAQPLVFDGEHPGPVRGTPAPGEGNAELLGSKEA